MGRSPCCEKVGLKKGPWTPEEDLKLLSYINQHGHGSWRALASKAGLQRCGKSCRLRWINYLRPDIKRGKFSLQEEQTIVQLHALLGNRWSVIAYHLPQRTDNEIKNFWNTHLKKKLTKMGIDPATHKPISGTFKGVNHLAQWETARLEAEARLARHSTKLHLPNPQQNHPHNFMRDEQPSIAIGGPIFQNPNKNLCVGHNHENDVSLSVEADGGFGFGFGFGFEGYINCGVDVMERNYHVGNDSESDNGIIMRGRCGFGHGDEQGNDINGRGQYGAGFEDNNVSTTYWDDIMSILHDSAQPLLLDPASSFASPFFLSS